MKEEPLIPETGEAGSTRCSPMHASRTSFAQDAGNQRDQRSRNLHLDLTVMGLQEPDEEQVDKEEVGVQNL